MHASVTHIAAWPAPLEWLEHDTQPHRACALCQHGQRLAGQQSLCTHPRVAGKAMRVQVSAARAAGGACGPEAEHLEFPGLHA